MISATKSPNMMSTTGRRPVIAAPTPIPVNPASEMGVSSTRSAPNSSTRPESTLNGVPASATSSPKMQTRESRRISSASASRTACANVSSRSGIDILVNLVNAGIWSGDREFHRGFHFLARFVGDSLQIGLFGETLLQQPVRVQLDGITLCLPMLFFLLGTVIFAIDVAHVMSAVTISVGLQECRTLAGPCPLHQAHCDFIDCAHILAVDGCRLQAEGCSTAENGSCSGFGVMRVFVVKIVFANVNDG